MVVEVLDLPDLVVVEDPVLVAYYLLEVGVLYWVVVVVLECLFLVEEEGVWKN